MHCGLFLFTLHYLHPVYAWHTVLKRIYCETFPASDSSVYIHCVPKKVTPKSNHYTTAHLIRINYPISSFNYHLSGTKAANFNKIHRTVSEQQLFKHGT